MIEKYRDQPVPARQPSVLKQLTTLNTFENTQHEWNNMVMQRLAEIERVLGIESPPEAKF
jgi:hypothetical protein